MTKSQRWLRINGLTIGGDAETEINEQVISENAIGPITIPSESTNFRLFENVEIWRVKAIAIVADQDCTVSTSGDETINLKANSALVWVYGDPDETRFFNNNFTYLQVTCALETVLKFGHVDYAGDD